FKLLIDVATACNFLVELRIGKPRLIPLIVAIDTATVEIDEDICGKLLFYRKGKPCRPYAGNGIVSVDMNNRNAKSFCNVCTIPCRPSLFGDCSKPNLIVDYNMDCPLNLIPF